MSINHCNERKRKTVRIKQQLFGSMMEGVSLKINKKQHLVSREDLLQLSKDDLVTRVWQLEAHVFQLKNIINKQDDGSKSSGDHKAKKRKFDFTTCHQRHVFFKLLYMGWDYQGFAVQENTSKTIEYELFRALDTICLIENRQTSNYHRCGRTDKGVSAFSQVISLNVRSKLSPENQHKLEDEIPYIKLLNRVLPSSIRFICWSPVEANLSARFDCNQRTYKYFFPKGDLNLETMKTAATYLIGSHDFRNLCKMDVGNGVVNYERNIKSAEIIILDECQQNSGYTMCMLKITGKAYLWHQIRCIMGILLLIGQGKEEPEVIHTLLDVEKNPRKPQYSLAHDIPLNLFHCEYESEALSWFMDEESISDVTRTLQHAWTMNSIKATMIKEMIEQCENMRKDETVMTDQSNCLLQGVTAKVYQPLMDRQTCEPLETRIKHFVKKQRLEVVENAV